MGAGAGCCGVRKGDNCCDYEDNYKTESDTTIVQVETEDGPEARERVKRNAGSLAMGVTTVPKKVPEKWISPVTCQGAVAAMELSALAQSFSSSLSFRTHLKSCLIQSQSLPQLLANLACTEKSLRLASVHCLCLVLTPQQSELISEFLKIGGVQELAVFLEREKGDGVVASVWSIALAIGQLQEGGTINPELISLLHSLVHKFARMKSTEHIRNVVTALGGAEGVVLQQLKEAGLAQAARRLKMRVGRREETAGLVEEVEEVYSLASQSAD